MEFEQVFMFYLPRICEHCLNPSCVASCPSGAMYKREEDGIVLVDQDRCRGWRFCVSGLPVQEGLLQPPHRQGREVHVLLPADRGRPADDLLGDLRRAAALPRAVPLRRRQGPRRRGDPGRAGPVRGAAVGVPRPARTPRCRPRGRRAGHPARLDPGRPPLAGLRAGRAAPGRAAAAPGVPHAADGLVHPAAVAGGGRRARGGLRRRRTRTTCSPPSTRCGSRSSYLANLFTAGDVETVRRVLRKLAAIRAHPCGPSSSGWPRTSKLPAAVDATPAELDDLYRLLAIAKYDDRYVIPPAHAEDAGG